MGRRGIQIRAAPLFRLTAGLNAKIYITTLDNGDIPMASKRRPGSIKRFGARYGRGVKLKFGKIEAEQRKKHPCPYCRAVRVKRVAAGIWECRKCGSKFTGRAYTVGTPRGRVQIEEEPEKGPETPAEAPTEEPAVEPVEEAPAPESEAGEEVETGEEGGL